MAYFDFRYLARWWTGPRGEMEEVEKEVSPMEHGRRQAETHAPRQKRRTGKGGTWSVGFILLTILLVGICTAGIFAAIFMKYVQSNVMPVVQIRAEDYTMDQSSFIYYQDQDVWGVG